MAYTTTGSVSYDTAAYDMLARYAYRPELYYDAWADVKPTNLRARLAVSPSTSRATSRSRRRR